MAKRDYIEGWLGRYDYVEVYRDDYSCRKRFKYREEEDEADAYFNYLQSLDNQEISIQKQNQIAEQLKRQNDLSEQQLKAQNHYNNQSFPRPVAPPTQRLDPEYEEWLRYKKATDPAYQKWKAEEERKKQAKIIEEKKKALDREREENNRYFDLKKRDIVFHKERIGNYIKVYKKVTDLYEKVIKTSFISSRKIDYYTEDSYGHFQIVGGMHLNDYDSIKSSYDYLEIHYKTEISDLNRFCDYIYQLAECGDRNRFDEKLNTLSSIDNQFYCFYDYLINGVKKIVEEYHEFSSPYYYENRFYYDSPRGLFTKQKIKSALSDYLHNNDMNYRGIKDIYQNLIVLLRTCNMNYS